MIMAKSELQKTNPSSDEEEEVSSEGSHSESESETTPPPPPSSSKTHATPQSSSDESESHAVSPPQKSKQPPGRVWSEGDEITLIEGMINYVEEKSTDPMKDVTGFHEFVKDSLTVDFGIKKMTDKLKKLQNKFTTRAGKIERNEKVRLMSDSHQKKLYELSENYWGKEGVIVTKKLNSIPKANQKLKGKYNSNVVHSKSEIRYPITDDYIMNRVIELAAGPKKVKLKTQWDELKKEEYKLKLEKLDLVKEQGEMVLKFMEKNGEDDNVIVKEPTESQKEKSRKRTRDVCVKKKRKTKKTESNVDKVKDTGTSLNDENPTEYMSKGKDATLDDVVTEAVNDEDTRTILVNQKKPKRTRKGKKSTPDKEANVVPSNVENVSEEISPEKNTNIDVNSDKEGYVEIDCLAALIPIQEKRKQKQVTFDEKKRRSNRLKEAN